MRYQSFGRVVSFISLPLILAWSACNWESPPAVLAADEVLRAGLDSVQNDYTRLQLPEAFHRARGLSVAQTRNGELRAEVYQYLAMLHFDRGLHLDSIGYYAELAGELVDRDSPLHLRARQQLCRALQRHHDWAWLEMDMACALGLRLLEKGGDEESLRARLQLTQGVARKMHAYTSPDAERKRTLLREAGTLMRQAAGIYLKQGSPWQGVAYEELGIVYSQLPEEEDRCRELADSIRLIVPQGHRAYARPERLLGYWHEMHGQADSMRYYYERLLEGDTLFRYEYVSEAYFMLREHFRVTEQFGAALKLNTRVLLEGECCPYGMGADDPAVAANCTRWSGCIYDVVEQAHIYYRQYLSGGRPADLDLAHRTALAALDHYSTALRSLTEESAFNQLLVLGDRLVSVALEVNYAMLVREPQSQHLNTLFRTVEFGNNYLLSKELTQLVDTTRQGWLLPIRDSLAAMNRELVLLKREYTRQPTLPTKQLERAEGLVRTRDGLQRRLHPAFENVFARQEDVAYAPDRLSVAEVQRALTGDQALLEFAETSTALLALYVDRDTAVAYTVDTGVLGRVRALEVAVLDLQPPRGTLTELAAAGVSDALFGPVATLLALRSDWLVIPSASLSRFPLAVLPQPVPPGYPGSEIRPYLIERHSLRYLDSWRIECLNTARRAKLTARASPPRIGVWTHPELNGYLGGLGALLTVRGASGSHHYVNGSCSSQQLLLHGGEYDWLHLSVHARGSTIDLNDNYLYLNDRDSLNGVHLGGRPMSASLVVLAACATARGVSSRREGTYSLRRSFHQAGVPDVVASLYDIPAAATAGILEEFYRGLWRGLTPERALAEAQRACLAGRLDRRWMVPGFWAGLMVG